MAAAPGTLGGMKARIALEIIRSDLTAQIAAAITTAITEYQKQRFRFSDSIPNAPTTFNTEIGRAVYTATDNAVIGTVKAFDYIFINIGNSVQYLDPDTPENLKLYNQDNTMNGDPSWYAYEGNQLVFAPVPSAVRLVTIGAFRSIPAPVDDDEADNPWMTDAELLIRSRAKYEIALHQTRNVAMQEAMSPNPPPPGKASGHATWWAFKSLKGEGNRVTGTGIVKPMQF